MHCDGHECPLSGYCKNLDVEPKTIAGEYNKGIVKEGRRREMENEEYMNRKQQKTEKKKKKSRG
jgi:hypothetical protein